VRAMHEAKTVEAEVYLHHKKGHRVPVLIKTVPVRNDAGKVVGAVEIFRDNSAHLELRDRLSQLEQLSMIDAVTGIGNRHLLDGEIKRRLDEFARYGWGFGILLADLDGFKAVNDRMGHDIGDQLLQTIGNTFSMVCRASDTPGRWGGDEFLVVCGHSDAAGLQSFAERVRVLVASSYAGSGEGKIRVTVSIGATLAVRGDDALSLVARADSLMYRSKQKKNCVSLG